MYSGSKVARSSGFHINVPEHQRGADQSQSGGQFRRLVAKCERASSSRTALPWLKGAHSITTGVSYTAVTATGQKRLESGAAASVSRC